MGEYSEFLRTINRELSRLMRENETLSKNLERAERALIRAGFEDRGGEEWRPPVNHAMGRELRRRFDLEHEVQVLEDLLTDRERVLAAIPECPAHGPGCVPHAVEWVQRARRLGV